MLRIRWREPHILFVYALKVATHYHYAAITRALKVQAWQFCPMRVIILARAKRRAEVQAAA